jgi:hypothetical protein
MSVQIVETNEFHDRRRAMMNVTNAKDQLMPRVFVATGTSPT